MAKPLKRRVKSAKRKPVQQRSRATQQALLKAAAQLLARRGYAELTTNHVAQRAGVSIGSLYEYFRDKHTLVHAVLDAHIAQGEELLQVRAAALLANSTARPLRELVELWVDLMLELHADDPKLHRVLFAEVPRTRATMARLHALETRAHELVTLVLASHPDARVQSAELSARLVVSTIEALTHRWVVDSAGAPLPLAALRVELVRMVTGYLGCA